jgi:hypothetical protein
MNPDAFRAYFPEFEDVTTPVISAAIARSLVFIDPNDTTRWAASAALLLEGQANLVAHFIVTTPSGKAPVRGANDIVSEDRPTLKFTRDAKLLQIQNNDPFTGSSYGVQYVYMRDYLVGKGAFVPDCLPAFAGCW